MASLREILGSVAQPAEGGDALMDALFEKAAVLGSVCGSEEHFRSENFQVGAAPPPPRLARWFVLV